MSKALEHLDRVTNMFVEKPWTFSTDLGDLKHIRYGRDSRGREAWYLRVWRAFGPNLWGPRDRIDKFLYESWWDKVSPLNWWAHVSVFLRKEDNLPDGLIPEAGVITFWAERGHFVSMMNPDVANAVLDFLRDRPEDKHAVRIRDLIEAAYKRLPAKEDSNVQPD